MDRRPLVEKLADPRAKVERPGPNFHTPTASPPHPRVVKESNGSRVKLEQATESSRSRTQTTSRRAQMNEHRIRRETGCE